MKKNHVRIGLYGVMAGVILGAGTLSAAQGVSLSAAAITASDATMACRASKDIAQRVVAILEKMVPKNPDDLPVHAAFRAELDAAVTQYCTGVLDSGDTVSSASQSSAAPLNNNCAKYPKTSRRYRDCKLSEGNSKTYKGY
jgi:hypothetical protein